MKTRHLLPFLFTLLAIAGTAAWAYIPPSTFLINTLARKHAGYSRIQVRSLVAQLDSSGQPTGVRFREQLSFNPATGVLKSWASDEHGTSLFESERAEKTISPAALLLFESHGARLIEALRAKGIPVQSESEFTHFKNDDARRSSDSEAMARWKTTVAWVIGAADHSAKGALAPQVWLEKDTFLPVRLISAAQPGDTDLSDIQYEGVRYFSEFPYPKYVSWYTSTATHAEPHLRAEALDVQVDGGPDLGKQAVHEGWTTAGESAPGPLRDLIRGYYGTLR